MNYTYTTKDRREISLSFDYNKGYILIARDLRLHLVSELSYGFGYLGFKEARKRFEVASGVKLSSLFE